MKRMAYCTKLTSFGISQQIRNQQLSFHIDEIKRSEKYAREIRNRKPPGYVCCTLPVFSDRLMPINRLSQPRTKLYCNEISKKLFPEYHDRRTTERTCSNMYIYSDFSIDIDLFQTESKRADHLKYN
ncbi:hypothetical protein T01_6550 [Trichinella spiralis]|uniref:Uncharacterized protein n=1 Tax=Trichinella spiralis TaxID=6334 RepID=A0A0V1BAT9_TRISP|nr:hypothetical protein T01_6550 [Trichinella spiralis]